MERYDTPKVKNATEAYEHMRRLVDEAYVNQRSVFLVSMKPQHDGMVDIKSMVMNMDQHEKALLMVAFALVEGNKRVDEPISDDLAIVREFIKGMTGE